MTYKELKEILDELKQKGLDVDNYKLLCFSVERKSFPVISTFTDEITRTITIAYTDDDNNKKNKIMAEYVDKAGAQLLLEQLKTYIDDKAESSKGSSSVTIFNICLTEPLLDYGESVSIDRYNNNNDDTPMDFVCIVNVSDPRSSCGFLVIGTPTSYNASFGATTVLDEMGITISENTITVTNNYSDHQVEVHRISTFAAIV